MKRALVILHMDHDHPGWFANFFAEDGIIPDFVRVFEGETIPSGAKHDLMFVLGGAQDTWEIDKYPWLAAEMEAIQEWVATRAKPYIGICLGHQLLAQALGGRVEKATVGEVGVHDLSLTSEGAQHPFFAGIEPRQTVMQWHFAEVSKAPASSVVLASSPTTHVQAFAIGNHALGTQFHCEFTPQSVAGWSSMPNYVQSLETHKGDGAYRALLEQCYPLMPVIGTTTRRIWDNFKRASGLIT
jgi:GMP synthase-like glutamine amidotransferase